MPDLRRDAQDFPALLREAQDVVRASSRIVVLTGAGISTDSGIPDFRGPDGLWTKNPGAEDASDINVFLSNRNARQAFWRMIAMMRQDRPKPNAGHRALVHLQDEGKLLLLVTQNVDGLHQDAGNSPEVVVEVHGGIRETLCLNCEDVRNVDEAVERVVAGEEDPRCLQCGGILKANIVLFGEQLPYGAMERALHAAEHCDLLICVGSTLSVYPVASMVPAAVAAKAKLIILNQGETPYDDVADYVLSGSISHILPALLQSSERIEELSKL
eukprot:TRINITY_DN32659_c0_g1_i1.p1 TRINITY_DN32659_c0_g1~~TRINITY_DN32659_c0_g1_i1.p1  ORF type:complete len:271 (-),score=50.05 TRINITY_DN32659_c0_g1_i1:103-915(-)